MHKTYELRGPMQELKLIQGDQGPSLEIGDDFMNSLPQDIKALIVEDNRTDFFLEAAQAIACSIVDPYDYLPTYKVKTLMPG